MNKISEIDKKIAKLENEYKNASGSTTEVYTRIVGYMRDVTQWNKGKKAEYPDRLPFKFEG